MTKAYNIGDLVCKRDLYNKYYIVNKKISKTVFNMKVGTVIKVDDNIITVRLLNDNIIYSSSGAFMMLDNKMAQGIIFDDN